MPRIAVLLLPLLCALVLPCAVAHCPTSCMEVAYLKGNYWKPFRKGALNTTSPLQAAAKCAEACSLKGTKYFNLDVDSEYTVDVN